MERKNILTSQKEFVKNNWKGDFNGRGVDVVAYHGIISAETYCAFISLDYHTVARLGKVSYSISYVKEVKEGEELFLLMCETYIDSVMNDKLSVILEASEDWLGMFTELGKAQCLPDNWKELLSDKQKEEIAREWCKNNSVELEQYLDDFDKERLPMITLMTIPMR